MDLEHAHAALFAALKGLEAGKARGDIVNVPPFGVQTTIFTALDNAKYLDEPFAEDDLELVDSVFRRLGLSRASNRKNEVALAILNFLTPPKKGRAQ